MAIGFNWAEGSYANSSWVTTAWRDLEIVFYPLAERTHIIAFSDRVQGVI